MRNNFDEFLNEQEKQHCRIDLFRAFETGRYAEWFQRWGDKVANHLWKPKDVAQSPVGTWKDRR